MANKSCAEAAAGPVSSLHCVGASTAITAVAPAGRDADRYFCCPSTTEFPNPTYDGKNSG
jgi:hypothetical protein